VDSLIFVSINFHGLAGKMRCS